MPDTLADVRETAGRWAEDSMDGPTRTLARFALLALPYIAAAEKVWSDCDDYADGAEDADALSRFCAAQCDRLTYVRAALLKEFKP